MKGMNMGAAGGFGGSAPTFGKSAAPGKKKKFSLRKFQKGSSGAKPRGMSRMGGM